MNCSPRFPPEPIFLPANLWHLQRYRKSIEEVAVEFDNAVPDVDDLFNHKVLDGASAGS